MKTTPEKIDIIKLIDTKEFLSISLGITETNVCKQIGQPTEKFKCQTNLYEVFYYGYLNITYYKKRVVSISILGKGSINFFINDFTERDLGFRVFGKKNTLHKLFSFLFSTQYKWEIVNLLSDENSLIIHIEKSIEIVYDLKSNELDKITIGELF